MFDTLKSVLSNPVRFLKRTGIFSSSSDICALWVSSKCCPNYGDRLTPYLIKAMTGRESYRVSWYSLKEHYVMVGSIVHNANHKSIIYGAGALHEEIRVPKVKEIIAVRGPLTRKVIISRGYPCPRLYGDPALLLPLYYEPNVEKEFEVGVIPHFSDRERVKDLFGNDNRVLVIEVFEPIEKVIDDINRCEKTISGSLHGLITSHAYGVPSLAAKFRHDVDEFRYRDYFTSVGLKPYELLDLSGNDVTYKGLIETFESQSGALPATDEVNALQRGLLQANPFKKARE